MYSFYRIFLFFEFDQKYFQIKLYEPTEMDALLASVGFTHIKRLKTYDHATEPSPRDHTIVYECKK